MARKGCTKSLSLQIKFTHVKQIHKINKSPTVHHSSLALPKTSFIMIDYIKPRPATKANALQTFKALCQPRANNQARKSKVNRWFRQIHCPIHFKFPPIASLVS